MSDELERLVKECNTCIEHRINPKKPFYRPMERIAADLFKSKRDNSWYLIITDYFSRYFKIFKLDSLTDLTVIQKMNNISQLLAFIQFNVLIMVHNLIHTTLNSFARITTLHTILIVHISAN